MSDQAGAPSEQKPPISIKIKNKIATISIATKMNAINIENAKLLVEKIKEASLDPKVLVIVFETEGDRIFSAGFDLTMFKSGVSKEVVEDLIVYGGAISRAIYFSKKVTIAKIQGSAIGLGCIMALSCDFRIVAERDDIFFQLPEIDINIYPATGPIVSALNLLPPNRVKEMLLFAKKVPLIELEEWGLISQKTTLEDLKTETKKFARELTNKNPQLLQMIKASINMMSMDQANNWYKLEDEMARYYFSLVFKTNEIELDDFLAQKWKDYGAGKADF